MGATVITGTQIKDASVGIADLSATGTPSSSTFLRGDNIWATPASAASDVATSILTASVNETIAAGLSALFNRSLTINSGIKVIIGLGARVRIL